MENKERGIIMAVDEMTIKYAKILQDHCKNCSDCEKCVFYKGHDACQANIPHSLIILYDKEEFDRITDKSIVHSYVYIDPNSPDKEDSIMLVKFHNLVMKVCNKNKFIEGICDRDCQKNCLFFRYHPVGCSLTDIPENWKIADTWY